jgi:hypothetical protein
MLTADSRICSASTGPLIGRSTLPFQPHSSSLEKHLLKYLGLDRRIGHTSHLKRGEEMVRYGRSAGWFRVWILRGRSLPCSTAAQSICGRFLKSRIFSITLQR